jgi:hypothetical protein
VLQLVEIDGDQSFAIVGTGALQAMAFGDSARGLAGGAETFGELVVG